MSVVNCHVSVSNYVNINHSVHIHSGLYVLLMIYSLHCGLLHW